MTEMQSIQVMQQNGTAAVKLLRKQKFARGLPFMISSSELQQDESYLEYPDGKMVIIKLSAEQNGFSIVKEIPDSISSRIRALYHLD